MRRQAGISIPLFSLRSTHSWGIGEIGDVPEFARWLGESGQSVLQILPVNELAPEEASPYSALSAMAIDPQFISMRLVEDDGASADANDIADLRGTTRIDYGRVRAVKNRALRACFDYFWRHHWSLGTARADGLRDYIEREAWWLANYSLYRAIRAEQHEKPWMEWPDALKNRDEAALSRAALTLERKRLFYQYVQWIADEQWQRTRRETQAHGVEIFGDFPFMVTRDSADVWSRPDEFLLDAQVGTPPDAFSETGQEWGLPPYNWPVIRATNFEWLRMRARRMAELYDGFRLDHLVGFYRTYVRPYDERAPHFFPDQQSDQIALGETIVRIMTGTGTDISVEDLGTVPDFVRASIARLGVPGYKVLRWEPLMPEAYPAISVAMTGTHDTEPLAVWWDSLEPDEQIRFGVEAEPFNAEIRDHLLQMMFDAGSRLLLLPIQDVFGWTDRINLPATQTDANWTWTLPWTIERLALEPGAVERGNRLAEWAAASGRSVVRAR